MNRPLEAAAPAPAKATATANSDSLLLVVNFSGGGSRAAAFAYGILDKLQQTRVEWEGRAVSLRDEIDILSGVSGGSITAAYFAASAEPDFNAFKTRFLARDFESELIAQALEPATAIRLGSPWYGRGNLLADRLDADLFHGVTFGQLRALRPGLSLYITATDLSLGTAFTFTRRQFALMCSDLDSVPLAVAVAASSAVPILFSPITLKNFAGACAMPPAPLVPPATGGVSARRLQRFAEEQNTYRDAGSRPYIHLIDGALSDNLGIKRLLDDIALSGGLGRSLADGGAQRVRKVVFINVNAGHARSYAVDQLARVPSLLEVAKGVQLGLLTRYTEETNESFAMEAARWRAEIRAAAAAERGPFSADADLYYIEVALRDHPDADTRAMLLNIPTAYTLEKGQLDALVDAGHRVLEVNPEFMRLLGDIAAGNAGRRQ